MRRRTACRLLGGLLLAGLGCGRSSSSSDQEVIELPPQRFPKAGRDKKIPPKKGTPPPKGG